LLLFAFAAPLFGFLAGLLLVFEGAVTDKLAFAGSFFNALPDFTAPPA
jgi:hypothetical protein